MIDEVRSVRKEEGEMVVGEEVPDGNYYLIPQESLDSILNVDEPLYHGSVVALEPKEKDLFPFYIEIGKKYYWSNKALVFPNTVYPIYETVDDVLENLEVEE